MEKLEKFNSKINFILPFAVLRMTQHKFVAKRQEVGLQTPFNYDYYYCDH